MQREIAAVIFFLKRLVARREKVESHKIELFVERLAVALQEKFKGHWYPDRPSKGQAYRCIRLNQFHRQDPELLRACQESGVLYCDLALPNELTLWVDPGEVCCRYGEQNPWFLVASFPDNDEDKDVAKKVTSALERVTSDYHSGSSDDECPGPLNTASCCADQKMNPSAPTWIPQSTVPGKVQPQPQHSFRPHCRAQYTSRQNQWFSPAYRAGNGYWDKSQYTVSTSDYGAFMET